MHSYDTILWCGGAFCAPSAIDIFNNETQSRNKFDRYWWLHIWKEPGIYLEQSKFRTSCCQLIWKCWWPVRREAEQSFWKLFELRKFEHKFEHSKIEIIRIKLGRSRAARECLLAQSMQRHLHRVDPYLLSHQKAVSLDSGVYTFFFQILKFFLVIGCFEFRNVEQAGPTLLSIKDVEFIHNYALKYMAERKLTSVFWISAPQLVAIKSKFQA